MKSHPKHQPIAVVGVAALFPGSIDKDGFWRDILAGRDLITDIPASHWLIDDYYDPDPRARDKTYCKRGAFLPEVDFDPVAWGVPPSILPSTDTNQLLALIVAQQVLEDACGGSFKDLPRDRVSVILGVTSAQELLGSMVSRLQRPVWVKALREMGLPEDKVTDACERIAAHYVEWQESSFPGILGNVVAGRIANRLDLGGTNCVTDAACASSLSALSMAMAELHMGHSDLVITGGADTMNDIFMYICFSKTPALSPTGDCRPFADGADGTLLGEGIGMVALKRLADAERDGDRIYAVVAGLGSSSDGRTKSIYAPAAAGQAKALRRAYQDAGYGPDTVELVEAHGTGTKAGDVAEFEALRTVFEESGRKHRGWCALGSIKSQIGHTKAAAGAAGLFKAVMALHHQVLPPTIKVDRPDPKLNVETSPFHINTMARPWVRDQRHPRRASVSSFGFGGSNFHVALQEYTGSGQRPWRVRPAGGEAVLLSGASAEVVATRCRELAAETADAERLVFLARSTQECFDARAPARLAVFAESGAELVGKLGKAAELLAAGKSFSVPGGIDFCAGPAEGDVGFLFPGQGSQSLYMGADVAMASATALGVWDRAAELDFAPGTRLHDVVFPRPGFDEAARSEQRAQLTATEWAQPALGATSLALLAILREAGVHPAAVAGHSFGELTALCAAGALTPEDLLRVARRRGELMAAAAAVPGAMTSVAARREDVQPLLDEWRLGVVVANHNSPKQLVLSGATEAISEVERRLGEKGIAATRLEVATAFHSSLVSPAARPLCEFLASLSLAAPSIPVFANTSAAPYPSEPEAMRDLLAHQLAKPVRFVEQIEAMYEFGVRTFVEVGPARVLTGLVGHILKSRPHRAIALDRKGRPGWASLQQGLALLSVAGVVVDYARLWAAFAPVGDPRARRKPAMALKLNGSSYGKIYPPEQGAVALPKPNFPSPPTESANPAASAPELPAAVAAAAPTVAPGGDPAVQLAWVHAFQESQRQTAEAHAAFQRAMAESHAAFLRASETSLANLASMLGGAAVLLPAPAETPAWLPALGSPPSVAMVMTPAPSATAVAPPAPPLASVAPAPVAALSKPAAPPHALPVPPAPAAISPAELQALMLSVVAAKTGYPAEMVGLDMDLETDLGVDSIKRVEILSAVTEKAPGLPEVSAARMAGMRTLREMVAYLGEQAGSAALADESRASGQKSGQVQADGAPGHLVVVATSPAASPAPIAQASIGRFALRVVPTAALGLATPGLAAARNLVVTDDGAGVGAALIEKLGAYGNTARLVHEIPADADAVVFLGGLRASRSIEDAVAVNREALRAARAVAARFAKEGGTFVMVQDTGGDFGLSGCERAWLAGPAALARTAAIEWPSAHVRAIDVGRVGRSPDQVAEVLCAELLSGGVEREVGLPVEGARVVLQTVSAPLPATSALPLDQRSVVVVSGGARGVTAACVIELARAARCRFLLLGRTVVEEEPSCCRGVEGDAELKRVLLAEAKGKGEGASPAKLGARVAAILAVREIRRSLQAIANAGGEARYVAVDVSDAGVVTEAVAQARASWGSITGVIHAAGALADKLIADKTDAQFAKVFRTKVVGLRALLDATVDDELAFLLLFSSLAAHSGNQGQADYAMANEVLNKVAALEQRRRGPRCLVRALGWGPWDGGMVDASVRARFAAMGVPLIPIEVGARLMRDELCAAGDAEVVIGGVVSGHGLAEPAVAQKIEAEIVVDRVHCAFLDGHRVRGVVVVPVALVLEWFARAARACRPDLTLAACRDVQVLRGIRLGHFDEGAAEHFRLRARQLSNGHEATIAVELLGADGSRHYSAICEMKERSPLPDRTLAPPSDLLPWSGVIYDGEVLFHGPAFQVIRSVDGIADGGLTASLEGVTARKWPGPWQLDPALLDGGLQAAVLWARRKLGAASLPTAISSLHIYHPGVTVGIVRCVLAGRDASQERAVSDVVFLASNGSVVAELRGIEVHALPRDEHPAGAPEAPAPRRRAGNGSPARS
jgi:acyl transferase domain-containing protein